MNLMFDGTSSGSTQDRRRRRLSLGMIDIAQLMVVLDAMVINIALPSAQRALGFTTVDRQWVVTARTLAFGSLLLPGGRLADLIGRRATFLAGLASQRGASGNRPPIPKMDSGNETASSPREAARPKRATSQTPRGR